MKRCAVLVLFVQIIWRTVAQITISTINSTDDAGTFIAGSEVTVICEIQSYVVFMNWKINSAIVAMCTFTTCSSKSNLPGHYAFSPDTDSGIFNLTINPVKNSDNGQLLMCENEHVNETLTVTVKGYKEEGAGRRTSKGTSTIVLIFEIGIPVIVVLSYICICGYVFFDIRRTWRQVPTTRLRYSVRTDSSLTVEWDTDYARVKWNCFIVSWYNDGGHVRRGSPIPNTGQNVLQYVIGKLEGRTKYHVTLEAKHFCRTEKADMIDVDTLGKPDPPNNFDTFVTESSISVKLTPGNDGGYKQHFILIYSREGQYHASNSIDTCYSKVIKHMTENENYILEIFPENQDRRSSQLKPLKQNPQGKKDLYRQSRLVANGVTKLGEDWRLKTIRNIGRGFVHKIENLTEKTRYIIQIFAENQAGISSFELLKVDTNGKPDPPIEFRPVITDVTEPSIAVEWKPGYDGGYKQHFILIYSRGGRGHAFNNNIDTFYSEVRKHMTEKEHYILEIFSENQDRRSSQLKSLRQNPEGKEDLYMQSRLVANGVTKLGKEWRLKTINNTERGFVQHKIENLTENTHYVIKIFAENQAGVSDYIKPLNVGTNGILYAAEDDYGTTWDIRKFQILARRGRCKHVKD